jgi:uncharacterized membrane protein
VQRTLLFLNLLLLMVVSLIPFPTAVLGRFVSFENDSHMAAAIYRVFISAPRSLLVYGLVALFYVFPWLPVAPTSEHAIAGEYK